jgi:hypothetical protein
VPAADKAAHVALGRQDTVTVLSCCRASGGRPGVETSGRCSLDSPATGLIRSRMTMSVPRDREVEAVKAPRRDWRGISR